MTEALVVGSINMDLVMRTPRLPRPGETLVGGTFRVVPGGKGANQAASASRLGHPTAMIGAVGDDDFGAAALDNLRAQAVDVTAVRRAAGEATGVAMILVDAQGRNTIVVASGANACLTPADVIAHRGLFRAARVVTLQCEIPLDTVSAAVGAAMEEGATTILNAAPAVPDLPEIALAVDFLVVNEQEAESLTGVRPAALADALSAAEHLQRRGPKCAVVTLGAQGCVYATASCSGHLPAPSVEAVDTTAAGDAFIGGLMAAVIENRPLEEALLLANCAGALAVTRMGAQSSLPDRKAVDDLFTRFRQELTA
ncbi:MAG: ribokinase [Anaerolineae bacterium]|nr:ribokinase [Anaerolineae bacterium]